MPEEPVQLPAEAMSSWILSRGEDTPARIAKHELVDAVRRLVKATALIDTPRAPVDDLLALAVEVSSLADRVAALPPFAAGPAEAGGDDGKLLERSGITGASNPLSAPLYLALDGQIVRGHATYGYQYEGPPGCVHGGFVAAAFDDLLGAAQTLSGTAGFTGTLTIKMVRPTPLNERIDYEGGVRSFEGRKIVTWGNATADGVVVAEAEGVFIVPRAGMGDERMARARAGLNLPPQN